MTACPGGGGSTLASVESLESGAPESSSLDAAAAAAAAPLEDEQAGQAKARATSANDARADFINGSSHGSGDALAYPPGARRAFTEAVRSLAEAARRSRPRLSSPYIGGERRAASRPSRGGRRARS